MTIPTVETPRLLLRPHAKPDFPACAQLWADPNVTRHITGRPLAREEVWSRLLRYAGHWAWLGFGYWAIEEKSSNQLIGEAGFADYQREVEPSITEIPEVGYVFATRAHGQGFATEALSAIVAWGDLHFQHPRTVCIVNPANLASLRVAEKCGYRQLHLGTYKGSPTLVLDRLRP